MNSIAIRAIEGDITACDAIEGLQDRYDVKFVPSYAEVEEDSILFVSCPPELVREFKWSDKGTICRNAIEITSSGIIPDVCKTQAIVLVNRGHRWNKIGSLVEEAIRMYLRYSTAKPKPQRLKQRENLLGQKPDYNVRVPWGGANPEDPRVQSWMLWWHRYSSRRTWDMTPVHQYDKRRKSCRGIRATVSDYIPAGTFR